MSDSNKPGPVVSAQVLLRSQSGKKLNEKTVVTAENIDEFMPSAEAVTNATHAFAAAGFEVSNVIGNNFSITAPVDVFEKVFHTKIRLQPSGSAEVLEGEDEQGSKKDKYKLPLKKVKKTLAQHVQDVTFSPPPDFGPTGSFQ